MELLTEEEAKALLKHPFINFSAVAQACFPDDPAAEQKLRGRVYSTRIKKVSKNTLERITIAFAELWVIMPHSNIL